MNIGGISMDAPAQAALGVLRSALDTQAGAVAQLMGGANGQDGALAAAAMAEQGKGQNVDLTV